MISLELIVGSKNTKNRSNIAQILGKEEEKLNVFHPPKQKGNHILSVLFLLPILSCEQESKNHL